MSRLLYLIGAGAARHPWRVVGGWLLVAIAVTTLASAFGGSMQDSFLIPGSDTQATNDMLADRFPAMSGTTARVVAHDDTGAIDLAALDRVRDALGAMPSVSGVAPTELSPDGGTAALSVQYDVQVTDFKGTEALDALEAATEPLETSGHQVELGGPVPENVQEVSGHAEMIGVVVALLILLLAFGALLAASLPLIVAITGLLVGTGGIALLASVTDMSTNAPTLASMVGLGVGIDYALFIVTRHRDNLARGMPVPEAAGRATATAGQSVIFAGGTVLVALAGLQFSGVPDFATMGYATGLVVLVTVLAAITLLPALLGALKHRVHGRRTRRQGRGSSSMSHSPTAARFARLVGRRPVLWLTGSTLVLLALAAPALGMEIGQSDAGNEPASNTVRRAYDLTAAGFGAGANGPLVVAVDLGEVGGRDGLDNVVSDISSTTNVARVSQPMTSPDGSTAVLTVTPGTGPQDARTAALVEHLRSDVLPDGAGITSWTAAMIDISNVLLDHLWVVISVVIGTSLLLLMVAFRSVVVPLKAALVNLLSIGSAYGVMSLAFQTETGARLLGLPGQVPIAAYVPLLMFAVLFGLSMDYEVFLLSSVREAFLRTGDSRTSVVDGLASTARVITSAALIMVAVFLGFAFDPSVVIKMIGVGMAAAIAIDATLIRLIVVPAAMSLLGRANWYLPRWLDRVLPAVDPHGSSPAPDTSQAGPSFSQASRRTMIVS
jgi:putative drug exporter of the RND superfamily